MKRLRIKLIPAIGHAKMRLTTPGEDEAMKTVAVWSVLFVVDDSVGGKDADETASLGRLNASGNVGTGTKNCLIFAHIFHMLFIFSILSFCLSKNFAWSL